MSTTTNLRTVIAREWQISNPLPPIKPVVRRERTSFGFSFFNKYYRTFLTDYLPEYDIDPNVVPSTAAQFLQSAFEQECESPFLYEMLLRHFLLACQRVTLQLFQHPSLTKSAIMHNELVICARLIEKRALSTDIRNFCDMLLAEVIDLYQGSYGELLESKFWSKTKGADDLIHQFLQKEIERLRTYNDYTFRQLGGAIMRKSIETAPSASVQALIKWRNDNNIEVD